MQSVAPYTIVSLEKPSLRIRQPGTTAAEALNYQI
jgi:hypothetical protein